MSGARDTVLLFGATGFVGGHILHSLLTKPSGKIGKLIVLTSSQSKLDQIRQWAQGLVSPDGQPELELDWCERGKDSKPWYDAARKAAARVDAVIQAATSDDLELTRAINTGLADARKAGKKGVLVHLSGVQLIESEPIGKYVETPYYDDAVAQEIQSIPDEAAHRYIDLEIAHAFKDGSIAGSIVCPALIWGLASGPILRTSGMVPGMVSKSLYNKFATYAGEGTNTWVHVHVDEVVDLILRLLDAHLTRPEATKEQRDELFSTFYFASHPDLVQFRAIAESIGKVLHRRGFVDSPEPRSVPVPKWDKGQKGVRIEDDDRSAQDPEIDRTTPSWPCRTNCRCKSNRSLAELGWKAVRAYDDAAIQRDAEDALNVILQEQNK